MAAFIPTVQILRVDDDVLLTIDCYEIATVLHVNRNELIIFFANHAKYNLSLYGEKLCLKVSIRTSLNQRQAHSRDIFIHDFS